MTRPALTVTDLRRSLDCLAEAEQAIVDTMRHLRPSQRQLAAISLLGIADALSALTTLTDLEETR